MSRVDRGGGWGEPLISVVLPAFNAERYVREAVQSILGQSFRNFELIVIDDGSRDGTKAILEDLSGQDNRIILVSRENKGLVASLNEGIELSRGKWIARMDADDVALPHRFECQLDWLEKTGADITGSWIQRFGSGGRRIVKLRQTNEAIRAEMLFGCPIAHPSVMMRSSLAKKLRYDKLWDKAEDYDLWVRAAEAGWKMTNVPEVLLNYRVHKNQVSSASALTQNKLSKQIQYRYWTNYCSTSKLANINSSIVIEFRETAPNILDLDEVDRVFSELLGRSKGEAKKVFLEHLTKLYCLVAADNAGIVQRWCGMHSKFEAHEYLPHKFNLLFLNKLHVRSRGKMYGLLRKLYLQVFNN